MTTGEICGAGAQCENTCPVMRMGRICPDLPTFLEEFRAIVAADAFTECEGSPQL